MANVIQPTTGQKIVILRHKWLINCPPSWLPYGLL